jgi:hypothetical protein
MNEKEILQQSADTILDKGIKIEVDILHPTLLQKWRGETKRVFWVKGLTLGSLIKISGELLEVDFNIDKASVLKGSYKLINDHCLRMAKIIAYAVVNTDSEPPSKLVSFFVNNLNATELLSIVNVVVKSMNLGDFLHSIASISGINILQGMNNASVTTANVNEASQ